MSGFAIAFALWLLLVVCGASVLSGVPYRIMAVLPTGNRSVTVVSDLLYAGKDWSVCAHYAKHPCGISIWIPSGAGYVKVEVDGMPVNLTGPDRYRIWRAYKHMGNGAGDEIALLLSHRIIARYESRA